MGVLAVVVAPQSHPLRGWAELMGAARAVAQLTREPVNALVMTGASGAFAETLAVKVWQLGAERVWIAADSSLVELDPERYVAALAKAARAIDPSTVLVNGDPLGSQLGPRLAMRLGASSVTEVVGVRSGADGPLAWVRPMYGGKAMAVVATRRSKVVVTVRPRAFAPPEARAGEPPREAIGELPVGEVGAIAGLRVVERRPAAGEGIRLEDARIIVSGGRGMGGPDGFKVLRQLAELLGGAVGASRAAVDAGWVPGHLQIGQTGKMVAPELYIAVGISGASQHLAGISGARHIVAINKDPDAPIFRVADIGLVEDWRKVLPLLIDRLAQVLGRRVTSQAG